MTVADRLAASDRQGEAYFPPAGVLVISVVGSVAGQQAESGLFLAVSDGSVQCGAADSGCLGDLGYGVKLRIVHLHSG